MEQNENDIRIRTVKVLGNRAKAEAIKQGCNEDDLVIVETIIEPHRLPKYKITRIEGSPTQFLHDRMFIQKAKTHEWLLLVRKDNFESSHFSNVGLDVKKVIDDAKDDELIVLNVGISDKGIAVTRARLYTLQVFNDILKDGVM